MKINFQDSTRRRQAFTLPEALVAVFIGITFILAMVLIFITSTFSFARMGDYINMDRSSRNALDHMTKNIRASKKLTSFDPALLVFNFDSAGTTNLTYRYDSGAAVLTEEWTSSGSTSTNVLLTGCSNLVFTMFNRTLTPTTDVSSGQGKIISVSWDSHGSSTLVQASTENMQQAMIVIRNQP
jgi:hypothetical protein